MRSSTCKSRGDSMVFITTSFFANSLTKAVAKVDFPSPGAQVIRIPRASCKSQSCRDGESSYCSIVRFVTGLTAVISILLLNGGRTTTILYGQYWITWEYWLCISINESSRFVTSFWISEISDSHCL